MDNVTAFLLTIRQSEGTQEKDGYNYLFGSNPNNTLRFTDFSTHPNIKRPYGKTFSTAAGAYQILYATWLDLSNRLNLHDFSPTTQDAMAIELLKECGSYRCITQGDLLNAVTKASHIWASLPGSDYGQPVHQYTMIKAWYLEHGGSAASV